MICFSSFVVLIIEMELEMFKITVLPLRQKMLNFSQRLVEDTPMLRMWCKRLIKLVYPGKTGCLP